MRLTHEDSIRWIESRRSVFPKEFENEKVSEAEVKLLLEAAKWAPTHKLTEPWRFTVISSMQKKEALVKHQVQSLLASKGDSEMTRAKAEKFKVIGQKSSAIVAIIMQRDAQERLPVNEELWAVACAVQNIHLHAASLNIGGYWSTGAMTNHPAIRSFLGISDNDVHMGWFYLGRYTQEKSLVKKRKGTDDYVKWM